MKWNYQKFQEKYSSQIPVIGAKIAPQEAPEKKSPHTECQEGRNWSGIIAPNDETQVYFKPDCNNSLQPQKSHHWGRIPRP